MPEAVLATRAEHAGLLSNTRFYLRLTLLVVLVVLAQVALMFWLVQRAFSTLTPSIEQDLQWKIRSGLEELRHSADLGVLTSDESVLEAASRRHTADPDVLYLGFRDAEGKLLFESGDAAALAKTERAHTVVETDRAYSGFAPIEVEGLAVGSVALAISKARLSAGSQLHERLLWVGAVGAAVALGLALLFVQLYIVPLLRLTHRAFEELKSTTEVAVASNEAKSRFLANMSHEIRTPMNGLLGILQRLEQTALTPNQTRYVDIMRSSGNSLLRIVNDILDISKLEAKKYELHPVPCDIRKLTQETTDLFALAAEHKGLKLTTQIAKDVPPWVVFDEDRVRQILANLLNNAVKFTDAGEVSLVLTRAVSDSAGMTEQLKFEVSDSGVGIPETARKQLFKPFSQVDESSTRAHQGTGLGLSIAQRLAHLMNGNLMYQPTQPSGSKFVLSIPLVVGNSDATGSARSKHRTVSSKAPVLVVDDNEINQVVALETLEQLGFEAELASGGNDALGCWETGTYAAILMDCQMPGMDGYQTASEIRNRESAGKRIPIIACTAHAFEEERAKVKAAGMDDFIAKPLDTEQLLRVLSRWITLDSPVPPPSAPATETTEPQRRFTLEHLQAPVTGQILDPARRPSGRTRDLFLELTPQNLEELRRAAMDKRASDVRALAHKLKGSAAVIGAEQLAEVCDRVQQSAEHIDPAQLSDCVAVVARLHAAVMDRLSQKESLEASA